MEIRKGTTGVRRRHMKKKKVIKTLVVMALSSLTFAVNVQALTITTSSHTYGSSYSVNIQKGEDKLINASEMVAYFNKYEEGFTNTIEPSAYFYKTGSPSGPSPAVTMEPLTGGASVGFTELTESNIVKAVRISGTGVGCTRMKGLFEWKNSQTNATEIKRYPYQVGIYVHMPATGIKVINSGVSDNENGIDFYTYVGSKDRFDTNVLPFDSSYLSWDKISNNAIQTIQTSTTNQNMAKISDIGSYDWSNSFFVVNSLKEGTATISVNAAYNTNAKRTIKVNSLTKPTYSVSEKELTLASESTVDNRIHSTISNLGNLNKASVKWTSSNTSVLNVKNDTSSKPVLEAGKPGTATLTCTFTDLVSQNNKSVSPTKINVNVTVKGNADIENKVITDKNTLINDGDIIKATKEGDEILIRVEEYGKEAGYKCDSSDTEVCEVLKPDNQIYSFLLRKKSEGTSRITVETTSGKIITFTYDSISDEKGNDNQKAKPSSGVRKKQLKKPKIKSLKIKKSTMYVKIKKKPSKYNATGFEIKIKRNGKTIIKSKWKKKKLKIVNVRKNCKYEIMIRTYKGKKKSKWTTAKKKVR